MKILYWFTTVLFSFFIGMSGVGYLAGLPKLISGLQHLGYPEYYRYILGLSYVLGAVILGIPTSTKIKEWAYAIFMFNLVSSVFSHLASNDNFSDVQRQILLIIMLGVSYLTSFRIDIPVKRTGKT